MIQPHQTPEDLAAAIQELLNDRKAEKILLIDMRNKPSIGDYILIATGTSARQVGALAHHVCDFLKASGIKHQQAGMTNCDWVIVDAGTVLVHIFRPEVREFYNLEKMWNMNIPEEIPSAS